jgi:hypothetical protein
MDNLECELAILRADFNVPMTFPEFRKEHGLTDDDARLAYRDYYMAFNSIEVNEEIQ